MHKPSSESLTDSTMLRNVGVACGHLNLLKIYQSRVIELNTKEIEDDLENNSIVVMEFIQLKLLHLFGKCMTYVKRFKRKK